MLGQMQGRRSVIYDRGKCIYKEVWIANGSR